MNNQAKSQNAGAGSNPQDLNNLPDSLLGESPEIREIDESIDKISSETKRKVEAINFEIERTMRKLNQLYADLKQSEKEASDKIDRLILEQAEDSANE